MSQPIIAVENLGKAYLVGHQTAAKRYTALRDVIGNHARGFARKGWDVLRGRQVLQGDEVEEFWALKDVSFDVAEGDVVGVIGRNGAGKSTLLKVLSRITEPSEGRVTLRGRVASLLEVGTGFHPELTGRENIFLNGAILGMSRAEIKRKFDEIVEFAEVERFLDTPVKRYSSGMYVRLAFAVAAHLEPEILVVDEVLAVGDVEFQKKCLGKMRDVAEGGRTVLFVSHNMAAIQGLCDRSVLFSRGNIKFDGDTATAVKKYLTSDDSAAVSEPVYRQRGKAVSVTGVSLLTDNAVSNHAVAGQQCTFRITYETKDLGRIGSPFAVSILLFVDGTKVTNLWSQCTQTKIPLAAKGTIDCVIPKWPLRKSRVRCDVFTHTSAETQDWIEEAVIFDSHDGDFFGSGVITNTDQGNIFFEHTWNSHAN